MKNWGIFFMMLTASCVWNSGFGEAQLLHIKKAEDTFASCLPIGISADGTTAVGRAMDGSNWEAFRWNPNHSADPFKILEPKAGAASTGGKAYDVSGDGSIVVGEGSWESAEHSYPKIWIDDVAIDFNSTFGGPAYAISDDGQVIATTLTIQSQYYVHWQIPYAHRWEIPSTFPPDYNPTVEPYSSDFTSMPMYEPPIYTPGSDYTGSRPAGISGDGNVLVGTSDIHLSGVAVRWYNEPGLGWMVEEFETYDKNRGTSAVAASYDGKVIVGNTLFNFGTEDVPTWETRGFAWPYENRKLYIWGTTALYESYSDVTETPSLVQVAAGAGHTVGLQENGEVLAWGVNGGPPIEPPDGLNDAIEIDAGYQHAIALKSDKTVVAWGNNDFGQATVPEGLNSVNAIAAGQYHNLALKEDGTVVAWGKNDDGQTDVPQDLGPVKDISAGYGHSLALLEDGSLVGWGLNDDGQASDPGGLENLVAIESGYYHNLSLDESGAVFAWGRNDWGQGDWWYVEDPAVDMSAGEQHSIVLYEDGSVVVLGYGDHSYNIPSGLWLVMDVAAGREHTAVLDMNLLRMLGTLSVESPDPHNYTMANDISGDGKIIVGSSGRTNSDEAVAVYWDDTGAVHRLEDLLSGIPHNGWEFQTISAVDHDGDSMTGLGIFEGNASQGWHLASSVVPPEEGDLFIEDTSAEDLGDGYHKVSWYGLLKRMENSVHWHVEHGWQFIGRGKADDLTIYDHGLGCWSWTSEKDYPYVYFYCLDSGWTYYKEGGSPGNREYYDFVKGKWIHETELLGGN